jgi:hypothetical protein
MTPLLPGLIDCVLLLAIVGVFTHGRVRYCWSFAGYLVAVFIGDVLTMAWPSVFFTRPAWAVRQLTYAGLKIGIAIQLATIVFTAFPGAKARALRVVFIILVVTASMMVGIPAAFTFKAVALEWLPRLTSGTIWLMTGVAILAVYYRIPLDPYHRAIITGFVPYHLITVTLYDLMHHYGLGFAPRFNELQPVAYLVLVAYWVKAAWRRDVMPDAVSPAVLEALHPWRARASA